METPQRWFWVGSRRDIESQLTAHFSVRPSAAPIESAAAGDVVVLDALAAGADCQRLPTGHVFGGARALKNVLGLLVYIVVDDGDRVGVQLARFCLADGVLVWHHKTAQVDMGEVQGAKRKSQRPSVDALLQRLQGHLQARDDLTGDRGSALQRLLQFEREDTLLHRLQDPETGLFDGPYATLKLDEEWKRARRFHQPLSLLLVDLGPNLARLDEVARRAVLAEAAGVFLNECRDIDILARFAPTVFLFLLPGTGPDGAEVLGKRILAALGQRFDPELGLRPAGGLCSVPSSEIPDRKTFLAVAEACLRHAEAAGAFGISSSWQ